MFVVGRAKLKDLKVSRDVSDCSQLFKSYLINDTSLGIDFLSRSLTLKACERACVIEPFTPRDEINISTRKLMFAQTFPVIKAKIAAGVKFNFDEILKIVCSDE